jgi:diphthamide biosynthesis enzyme Dph1/Dph2 domain
MENCTMFYIGGESLGLTNLLMTHSSCEVFLYPTPFTPSWSYFSTSKVYSYDPRTKTALLESTRTNKLLMRRYAVVQKARDADVFGILVGTLGVGSFHPLFARSIPLMLFTYSILPSSHPPHPVPPHSLTQKKLHNQRREIESLETCKFYGNWVLCPCCMSRE